jgi:hypothetical protein
MPDVSKDVEFGNSGGFDDLSDLALCTLAVQGGEWKKDEASMAYVEEAKSRRLTREECTPK